MPDSSGNFFVTAIAALAPLAVGAAYPPDTRNRPQLERSHSHSEDSQTNSPPLSPTSSHEHEHYHWISHALHPHHGHPVHEA